MKKGKVNLEDLTKDELLWYIRKNQFFEYLEEKKIISDCLFYRMEKIEQKRREYSKNMIDALREYNEILKPYQGMKISELPSDIITKGAELERKIKDFAKKEKEYEEKYMKTYLSLRRCDLIWTKERWKSSGKTGR